MSDGMSGQRYSDDDFDRALRDLTEGTAAEPRFREASAAERARQAKEQAKQHPKRTRKQSRRRRWQGRTERDHGRATRWTGLGVILMVATVGGFLWLEFGPRTATTTGTAVAPITPVAPVTADSGPPADPFAGTPAQTWADGAAGIVTPAAKPVGSFTAAQVAAAYQTTKKLLIALRPVRP